MRETRFSQVLLGLGGSLYLAWWFAVHQILPRAFNPLGSRLVVVGYFAAALALTLALPSLRRFGDRLYYLGVMLLTVHYFYLFRANAGDSNWIVGCYLVVCVVSISISSRGWLIAYSAQALLLGVGLWLLVPSLRQTIFLPGLMTILCLCMVVLLGRMRLLVSLAESTGRFQNLFEAGFEGVVIHDQGVILDVNQALAELFQYRREELVGMNVLQFVTDPTSAQERLSVDAPQHYETEARRRDGSIIPVEVSSKTHFYRGKTVRLATVRDLSELRRAEAERLQLIREQAARQSAQEALRMREEFMAIASHELRTPLTSLQLELEGAIHKLRKLPLGAGEMQRLDTFEARSITQIARLNRLIQQLLDVSGLTGGNVVLHPELLTVRELVGEAVAVLKDELSRAGCTVQIQPSPPVEGRWDRLRLEQVLSNLLRNALLYGAGKPIEIGWSADAGRARLFIRDHGIGIDKASQTKVFDRFERAVSASHYSGLGLGLYISKQIVEAHGGTIAVDSEPGQGATFSVELPLQPA